MRHTALCLCLCALIAGCGAPAKETPVETVVEVVPEIVKPDLGKIKAEIQALETAWAEADNARDTNTLLGFYGDDAISMSNNAPSVVGKEALTKEIESNMAERVAGNTVVYTTLEVFGNEEVATEIGTSTTKDATGKIVSTGKYMAVWERRNGKYVCIRDIYNSDTKE
ncbi:YybH family protein [Namhaeicola litoreus]|uniref:YybH family protein n=1 Tax=Namhaeicola litoreus TaxID=1052145 RepID=A0ABW3XYJ1_9FLAO